MYNKDKIGNEKYLKQLSLGCCYILAHFNKQISNVFLNKQTARTFPKFLLPSISASQREG
jgi:DNA-binding XRE family transcriptional regulator